MKPLSRLQQYVASGRRAGQPNRAALDFNLIKTRNFRQPNYFIATQVDDVRLGYTRRTAGHATEK